MERIMNLNNFFVNLFEVYFSKENGIHLTFCLFGFGKIDREGRGLIFIDYFDGDWIVDLFFKRMVV